MPKSPKPKPKIVAPPAQPEVSATPDHILRPWILATLLVVPLVLVVLGTVMVNAQGPWGEMNRVDPEYCYLLNSLNILTFHIPDHTDHPGTTLQEFGAVVLFLKWVGGALAGGWITAERAVLSHPDDYLRAINFAVTGLTAAAVFFAGFRLYAASGSLAAALILQFSVLMFQQTIVSLPRISPEPFLIAVGFVLMIPLIAPLLGRKHDPRRTSLAAGAIFGFGMITKVTFLPIAAVAALLGDWRARARFAAASAITALFFAIPILPKVPRIIHWLVSLALHSDRYGEGPVGLPSASTWMAHLSSLYQEEPMLFYLLFFYAAVIACLRFAKRDALVSAVRRLLWVVCAALTLQLILTLKHYAAHYMLPALVICALANAFIVLLLSSAALPPVWRKGLTALAGIVLAAGLWSSGTTTRAWMADAASNRVVVKKLADFRAAAGDCTLIGYYTGSAPWYGLYFGSGYSAAIHGKMLKELYGDLTFYDPFGNSFRSFALEPRGARVQRMLESGRCVLVQGMPLEPNSGLLKNFLVEPVAAEGGEAIYRLSPGPPALAQLRGDPVRRP